MKRVLCGRTPWSMKKQQRSADSWIDGWISDHGYESGNDMYRYPMIWKWNGYNVSKAYKLDNYDALCDEIEEALENSRSEKRFREELDNLIDSHLGFVSDEEIAEMEGNNSFADNGQYEDKQNRESKILYLDNYSEDEIRSMNLNELITKHKLLYHNIVYGKFVNLCVEDVYDDNAVVDLPITGDTRLEINIDKHRKFNKLTISIPNRVERIKLVSAGCNILDLSNCECDNLTIGSGAWDVNTSSFSNLQTIVLPDSSANCNRIYFEHKCLARSKISTIVNSENIYDIGIGAFQGCKHLTEISLSADVTMYDNSFKNSNLQHVNWYGNITNSILKPIANSYDTHNELESLPFEGCPYQKYFIENYVEPFLDEIGE